MNNLFTPPAIIQPAGTELANLATAINEAHEKVQSTMRAGLEYARAAGNLLIEAKARLRHGEWLPWVKANCRPAERTARLYMQIASQWDELQAKSATVADLTFREAGKLLSAPAVDPCPNTSTWTTTLCLSGMAKQSWQPCPATRPRACMKLSFHTNFIRHWKNLLGSGVSTR